MKTMLPFIERYECKIDGVTINKTTDANLQLMVGDTVVAHLFEYYYKAMVSCVCESQPNETQKSGDTTLTQEEFNQWVDESILTPFTSKLLTLEKIENLL